MASYDNSFSTKICSNYLCLYEHPTLVIKDPPNLCTMLLYKNKLIKDKGKKKKRKKVGLGTNSSY